LPLDPAQGQQVRLCGGERGDAKNREKLAAAGEGEGVSQKLCLDFGWRK
jgi:hypothetical protein